MKKPPNSGPLLVAEYLNTECGGLTENGLHRLVDLNTQTSLGRIVWEGLEV